MAGRPSAKVELNLNHTEATLELIKPLLLKQSTKQKIIRFAKGLNSLLNDTTEVACQTELIKGCDADCQTGDVQAEENSSDEILEIIDCQFQKLPENERLVCSFADSFYLF